MPDYLEGWKDKSEVTIPDIQFSGFRDQIIIRQPVEPVRRMTYEAGLGDDSETVLVSPSIQYTALVKRLKTGEELPLQKDTVIIGKLPEDDIVISDNPTISRRHAEIVRKEDGFYLHDLGSSNHIFISGKQITEPVRLTDGMIFRLSEDDEFEFIVKHN